MQKVSPLRVAPRAVWWGVASIPLGFLAIYVAWPSAALLWRAMFGDALADTASTLSARTLGEVTATTLGLATAGTITALLCGLAAAWALYRLRWPGAGFVRILLSIPFALPTIVVAIAYSRLIAPDGLLSATGSLAPWIAIAAALAVFNVAVVMRVVGGAWAALDPALVNVARTLGASRFQAWWHVTMPALRPAIAGAAALVFLFCSTSFAIVLVLGGTRISTLETEIWFQVNIWLDLRAAALLAVVQIVTVVGAVLVSSHVRKRSERKVSTLTSEGTRPAQPRDTVMVALALLPALVLVLAPTVALIEGAFTGPSGWTLAYVSGLISSEIPAGLSVPIWQATLHSLEAAALATAIAVPLGLALAWSTAHSRKPATLEAVVLMPVGVSAVIVGLGLLLTLASGAWGPGWADPRWLIPAAQAVIALPLVARSVTPALRRISPQIRASAATLGAGPWAQWKEIDWPAARRPLAASVGLAAAVSLGEFGATAFLARPDHPTLPTVVFRMLSRPGAESLGTAFAATLLLAVVTGIAIAIGEMIRGRTRSDI